MKFSFSSVLTFALAAVPAVLAATLQEITSFGPNPTNTKMYVYVPEIIEGKTAGRPLVVELHYCTGNANSMFSGSYGSSTFRTLAEEYGWVVLYPESPDPGGCWDVHTSGTLLNNGGGDSLGVASQIQYVINNYGVDPTKIFATGLSSGASMAINLAATYPNLIAGSSAFAGVPFGCFAGPNIWNNACADGLIVKVAAEWGNMVRNAYPGFTGVRPKIQIWHGTQDEIFDPVLINEHIKQWTNVFGVGTSPTSTVDGFPNAKWTRRLYGSRFQMFTSNSQHIFEIHAYTAAQFFNILTPPPNPNPTTSPTPVPPTGFQEPWGQCGGMGYTGPTVCVSGYTCVFEDPYYSQCR